MIDGVERLLAAEGYGASRVLSFLILPEPPRPLDLCARDDNLAQEHTCKKQTDHYGLFSL